MPKVLLTGATGFVGSYIARLLLHKGYEVIATRRTSSPLHLVDEIKDKIKWIEASLGDILEIESAVIEADYIIHAAALVSFQPKDRMAMYTTNVAATHDLVNLALIHGTQKFIHISSIAALGRHKNSKLLDELVDWEDSPLNTNYAISKQLGEREVWRGHAEGLAVSVLCPSLVLGAGDWGKGTPAMFSNMHRGYPFYPTGSTGVVDVRDVAELTIKALESDTNGEKYIVSGENISYRKILDNIALAVGVKPPRFKLTSSLSSLVWRADALLAFITRKERLVSKETLASASRNASYDNSKSINTLGHIYRPIEDTIRLSGQLFKSSLSMSNSKGNKTAKEYGVLTF